MIPRKTNTVVDPVPMTKARALHPIDWNEDQVAQMTQLWATGMSAQEIANRMGITKNAVVGKARRLNLTMRREPQPKPRGVPMIVAEDGETVFPPFPKRGGCLWPEGSGVDVTFCGAPQEPGRPYCTIHTAKAYVKPKDYTPEQRQAMADKMTRMRSAKTPQGFPAGYHGHSKTKTGAA